MKWIFLTLFPLFLMFSCNKERNYEEVRNEQWGLRRASAHLDSSYIEGMTYLSVYSQIYSGAEHITHNLTATASIRNVSVKDTIYVTHASYFDTHGKQMRDYLRYPIYVKPMETVFIVIEEADDAGGAGGNFLFTWQIKEETPEPLFESVMISTSGQQGLSFSVQGKRVK